MCFIAQWWLMISYYLPAFVVTIPLHILFPSWSMIGLASISRSRSVSASVEVSRSLQVQQIIVTSYPISCLYVPYISVLWYIRDFHNLNYLPYLIEAALNDFVLGSFVFSLLLFRYFNNITVFIIYSRDKPRMPPLWCFNFFLKSIRSKLASF